MNKIRRKAKGLIRKERGRSACISLIIHALIIALLGASGFISNAFADERTLVAWINYGVKS